MKKEVIGVYGYKTKGGKTIYCFLTKENGKIKYNFTKSESLVKKAMLEYANSNNYTKENKEKLLDDVKFNLNLENEEALKNLLNENYKRYILPEFKLPYEFATDENFSFEMAQEEENLKDKFLAKIKNIKFNKKTLVASVVGVALAIGGFNLVKSLSNSKDNNANKEAISAVSDLNRGDILTAMGSQAEDTLNTELEKEEKAKEEAKKAAEAEAKAKEEAKEKKKSSNNVTRSSSNSSSSSSSSNNSNSTNSSSNTSSSNTNNTPTTPTEGNSDFQDPNMTIDDVLLPEEPTSTPPLEEDNYQDVYEEETPVESTPDNEEDYDQVIDVAPPAVDEVNPTPDPGDEIKDEDLTTDNITLDDEFKGNEDSILDGSLTFDDDGVETLPDPTENANNNGYDIVESEEVYQETENQDEVIEEVPVVQEEAKETVPVTEEVPTTLPDPNLNAEALGYDMTNVSDATLSVSYTDPMESYNEQVATAVVNAMENGENIVYNPDTNEIYTEPSLDTSYTYSLAK